MTAVAMQFVINHPMNNPNSGSPSPEAERRYRVLEEVRALGTIAAVCRRAGVTPQTYRLWKKRYTERGLLGLHDRPRAPSPGRPKRLTAGLQLILIDLVRDRPLDGCVALSGRMQILGIGISSPTIQKFLISIEMGRQQQRQDWVAAGCPPIGQPVAVPTHRSPTPKALDQAKAYYFTGIPAGFISGAEIQHPTLQQVAQLTNISLQKLEEASIKGNWVDARGRFLTQVSKHDVRERVHRNAYNLNASVLSSAFLIHRRILAAFQAEADAYKDSHGRQPWGTAMATRLIALGVKKSHRSETDAKTWPPELQISPDL